MNKAEILKRIHDDWLIMIMRGDTEEETETTCEDLIAGGATLIEVPFTTPGASRIIRNLRGRHGDRIVVAAGTVTTVEQAEEAVANRAQAIVSPCLHAPVVEFAVRRGVVSSPGCVTPTEIADALRLGADLIKLFPCYNVGPEYIGFILGPLPGTRIVPAGRVTLENMAAYHAAGAFAGVVGVTTEMGLLQAVKSKYHDEVTRTARVFVDKVRSLFR